MTDEFRIAINEHLDQRHYEWVDIEEILVPKSDTKLDEQVVAGIAESILLHGILHPIAVRNTLQKQDDGETKGRIVVVAGVHRREAMKRLGQKKIPCFYVEGNDVDVQMVHLGEDLWRKNVTVLRRAEQLVEYFRLATAKVNISGQPVQKGKIGRPQAGIALAARKLPLVGRSEQARRKILTRAEKINRITLEAKIAAVEAGLDNNQEALLRLGQAHGRDAQLRVVAELAKFSKELSPLSENPARSAKGDKVSGDELVEVPSVEFTDHNANDSDKQKPTTFDEMMGLMWNSNCREKWSYLPTCDRERIIDVLRHARKKAPQDVVGFLEEVFRGRDKVRNQDLFGIAATHGFSRTDIRKAAKGLSCRIKRTGVGMGARWFFMNPDRNWKEQLPVFSDATIVAAADAQPDPRDTAAKSNSKNIVSEYYLDDV